MKKSHLAVTCVTVSTVGGRNNSPFSHSGPALNQPWKKQYCSQFSASQSETKNGGVPLTFLNETILMSERNNVTLNSHRVFSRHEAMAEAHMATCMWVGGQT